MPSPSISNQQIARGINRSATRGYHNLNNKNVNVIAGNPSVHFDKHKKKQHERIPNQIAEDGLWYAQNNRMGGFRTAPTFEGTRPTNYKLSYERDFRPVMVGDVHAGGAFMGGFTEDALIKPRDKDYPEPMGKPLTQVNENGNALKQVEPFPIRLMVKPKNIAHFSDKVPDRVPVGFAM
jgi:hypothetical protein